MKNKPNLTSNDTRKKVREYLAATQAKNTKLAYQNDLAHFLRSGGKIPATPSSIASYLAIHAQTLSIATLNRRVVAIGRAHTDKGLVSPTQSTLVTNTLRGIRRINGSAQRRVMPLLKTDMVNITKKLTGLIGLRDKALLLIGFAGAFRRSELVAIQVEDIRFVPEGLVIRIRRSKTDQIGLGRNVAIPTVKGRHCPVRALKAWLEKSRIKTGTIFRRMNRFDQLMDQGLCAPSVALIIKQRVADADFNPKLYSGHSLRAGLVTSAAQAGVSSWKIRQQTAHKSDVMLQRYIRDSQLFVNNAVSQIW
ncbi:MAG: tyrosine-type recombinase/integrase [Nitrosomonas sp.]|nr:tyrosine-type recombinase/integrase [Nitrosomonas sp.]